MLHGLRQSSGAVEMEAGIEGSCIWPSCKLCSDMILHELGVAIDQVSGSRLYVAFLMGQRSNCSHYVLGSFGLEVT